MNLWTLLMTRTARNGHGCVSDTAIIKAINSFLIGFKKVTNVWYCKSSQEPMIWKLTGSRSELTTVILDFVTNLSLHSHIDTHRLAQLSYLFREMTLCRRGLLTQKCTHGHSTDNISGVHSWLWDIYANIPPPQGSVIIIGEEVDGP